MAKIKPFWRVVLGFLILCVIVAEANAMPVTHNPFGFIVSVSFFSSYLYLAIRVPYDDPLRSMRDSMAEQAAQNRAAQAAPRPTPEEASERKARQEEWERTHGRLVTAIAGVTFDNDDGTSRQRILKDLKARGDDGELVLEEYEYKGAPAVRVLVDDLCIGNIPKSRVQAVLAAMDAGVTASHLDIETFRPDDDDDDDDDGEPRLRPERIYRADLTLIYRK